MQHAAGDGAHSGRCSRGADERRPILADARSNGIRIDTDGAVQIVPTNSNPEGEPLALLPRFNGRGGVFALRSDGGINDLLARSANPVGDALDLSTGSTASLAQIVAASADGKLIALVDPAAANADPKVSIAEFPWETQKPDPNTPMNSKPRRLASWPLQSNWNRTQPDTVRDFKFQFAEGGLLLAVDTADGTIHRFDAALGIALAPVKLPIPPPAQSAFFIGGQDNTLEAFGVNRKGTELAIAQNGVPLRAVASDGSMVAEQPLQQSVASIVAAGGGYLLAFADGSIDRWDGRGALQPFARPGMPPHSLVPVESKNLLIASTLDGISHFFYLATGQERMTLVVADNARDWRIGTPDGRIDASDFGMTGVRWKLGEGTFADSTPVEAYADDLMAPGLEAEILQPVKAQAASQITTRERRTGVITLHAATPKLGSANPRSRSPCRHPQVLLPATCT